MDAYLYDNWQDSPIFKPEWLGRASSGHPDHIITDNSFWASVQFPSGVPYVEWNTQKSGYYN